MPKANQPQSVTAVLFDWDLTLAHVIGVSTYSERLRAIFHSGGLEYPLADIEAAMRSQQVDTALLKLSMLPGVPQTQVEITQYYRDILRRLGFDSEDAAFFNRLYDIFAELPLTLYDDALSTLEQLHQQGIQLGIITNHSRLIRPIIDRFVGQLIPPKQVIISQEIDLYKPSPAIFRFGASELGVAPVNCLFVGDNLYVDAVGAVKQGEYSRGVWVDREERERTRSLPAEIVRVTSLSQVLDYV
jgi:HAD superfamily hydrolase (TIGR01509 family)